MNTVTPASAQVLSIAGFSTYAEADALLTASKSDTSLGRVSYNLWSAINDFKSAESNLTAALTQVAKEATKELQNLANGCSPSTTWVIGYADDAKKYQVIMESSIKTIKEISALRNLLLEGK